MPLAKHRYIRLESLFIKKNCRVIFNPDVTYTDYFDHPDSYIDTFKIGID